MGGFGLPIRGWDAFHMCRYSALSVRCDFAPDRPSGLGGGAAVITVRQGAAAPMAAVCHASIQVFRSVRLDATDTSP